jgi:hypothetical protein
MIEPTTDPTVVRMPQLQKEVPLEASSENGRRETHTAKGFRLPLR